MPLPCWELPKSQQQRSTQPTSAQTMDMERAAGKTLSRDHIMVGLIKIVSPSSVDQEVATEEPSAKPKGNCISTMNTILFAQKKKKKKDKDCDCFQE